MSSTRELKQRIENIGSVEQLIHAMDMVASTKLIGARRSLEGIRPLASELTQTVEELGRHAENRNNKFFNERPIKNSLYIVFSSDKGLAGSYNTKILQKALNSMNEGNKNEKIVVIGSIGHDFFKKNKKNVIEHYYNISDDHIYYGALNIAEKALDFYLEEEVDEVYLVYTHFENILKMNPRIERLLPLQTDISFDYYDEVEYEPSMEVFIENTIPLYLHMSLFHAFTEANASEQGARSVAMDAASDNASDLLEDLDHQYNRQRQTSITKELNEIVSSAQAMGNN